MIPVLDAAASVFGNLAVSAGLITVVVSGLLSTDLKMPPLWGDGQGFFRFFGSVTFLFAVHIVFYPVMQSLKDRTKFVPTMQVTYVIVTVSYSYIRIFKLTFHCLLFSIMFTVRVR